MKPLLCPEDGKPCKCSDEPVGTEHRTGEESVMGCPRERCGARQNGLQRCWSRTGHKGAHAFSPPQRAVQLSLTEKMARAVLQLARRERKHRQKEFERSTFVAAPGKYDANLAKIAQMDDLIKQLEPHLPVEAK